jgi:hypothetical protein
LIAPNRGLCFLDGNGGAAILNLVFFLPFHHLTLFVVVGPVFTIFGQFAAKAEGVVGKYHLFSE